MFSQLFVPKVHLVESKGMIIEAQTSWMCPTPIWLMSEKCISLAAFSEPHGDWTQPGDA